MPFDAMGALKFAAAAAAVDYVAGGAISNAITPADSTDNTKSALRTGGAAFVTALVLQNL